MSQALLAVNWGLALILLGLILTIQFVHYPLFGEVGEGSFERYHALHEQRVTWLVGPLMCAEALAAAALVLRCPEFLPGWVAWVAAGLVVAIWLDTVLWAVPVHERLAVEGLDPLLVGELCRSNLPRTLCWAARAGLLGIFVIRPGLR